MPPNAIHDKCPYFVYVSRSVQYVPEVYTVDKSLQRKNKKVIKV